MTSCITPTLGRLPRRMDRFGQITAAADPRLYLRFVEGGEGDGAGAGDGEGAGDGAGELGDAGKQALDRMKSERNAARAEAKAFKDLGLSADEVKALRDNAPKPENVDPEKLEKTLRVQIEKDERARSAAKFRASSVREVAATLGFIDPREALALVDQKALAQVDVDDDDEVDTDEVKKLLSKLATDKPHLLKPTDTTADHRTAGIGATGSGTKPDVRPGVDRVRQAYANTPKK